MENIQKQLARVMSVEQVSEEKEKNIVGLLLNLLQAKNFYENYGDLFNSFMSAGSWTAPSHGRSSLMVP